MAGRWIERPCTFLQAHVPRSSTFPTFYVFRRSVEYPRHAGRSIRSNVDALNSRTQRSSDGVDLRAPPSKSLANVTEACFVMTLLRELFSRFPEVDPATIGVITFYQVCDCHFRDYVCNSASQQQRRLLEEHRTKLAGHLVCLSHR